MPARTPFTAVKNVRLLPETLAYLDALAARRGTTSSDLIRVAVDEWVEREVSRPRRRFEAALERAGLDQEELPL